DPFLGKSAFAGPVIEFGADGGSFAGQARFSGCIACTNWRRSDVEAILPPYLELATNTTAPELHPVVFIFGEQSDGAILFAGFTVRTGVTYHELGIVVPFVQHHRGRHLHSYVPRMYASYFPSVWHGNANYGFSKEMARMGWQGPVFLLTRENGSLLLHAETEPAGTWSPGSSCDAPNFGAMRAIFELPVIGRRGDGSHVCSYFGWSFEDALVRPSDACVSIHAPLVAGIRPRRHHDVPGGTFEVRGMLWRLSWPVPCRF
ncbi:MAG TPA: hypothetical protein VMR79_01565, partial [Verrucomicrobiae bacterium]|nr:hypothetical protein [Verrucomicrobiae bacterium]